MAGCSSEGHLVVASLLRQAHLRYNCVKATLTPGVVPRIGVQHPTPGEKREAIQDGARLRGEWPEPPANAERGSHKSGTRPAHWTGERWDTIAPTGA